MDILIYILIAIFIFSFIPNFKTDSKPSVSNKMINYKCQDCGYRFQSTKSNSYCPECKSDFIDELATIAGLYMLGDWLGFWGNDDSDSSSGDSFGEDPWDDDFSSFDEY